MIWRRSEGRRSSGPPQVLTEGAILLWTSGVWQLHWSTEETVEENPILQRCPVHTGNAGRLWLKPDPIPGVWLRSRCERKQLGRSQLSKPSSGRVPRRESRRYSIFSTAPRHDGPPWCFLQNLCCHQDDIFGEDPFCSSWQQSLLCGQKYVNRSFKLNILAIYIGWQSSWGWSLFLGQKL